ncbi:MAG TPA: hypothetical protein VH024_17425 [Candidatus Angelobacter sp.]|jgi:hypothetical protein|nr:hypothetical protein [Candidatus Angelobacter sp.]
MSDSPGTVDREPAGIADIMARREGDLPPDMLRPEPDELQPERQKPEASPQDDAEAVVEQLKRDAEQLRSRTVQAEAHAAAEARRAREVHAELQRTRAGADDANYNTIANALEARSSEAERLKAQMKSAGEAGDFAQVADISQRLGEIGAELSNLRAGKEQYEAERNARLREPPQPQREAPAHTEWTTVGVPRDQFLAGRTPKTQEWLRTNDKFFTDQSFFNMVTGADALARGRGMQVDTPEYFRFIEEQTGMSTPPRNTQSRGSAAPPATPPSRDAPTPTGRPSPRAGDVYVSPEQRRIAEWMFSKMPGGYKPEDAEQYAREERELTARGETPHRRR